MEHIMNHWKIAEDLRARANELFRLGDALGAMELYSAALAACDEMGDPPEFMDALYNNRSACKLKLKDYIGALADAQATLAINPKSTKALYRSAVALFHLGTPSRLPEALQLLQQAEMLDPKSSEVKDLKRQLQQRLADSPCSAGAAAWKQHPTTQQQQQRRRQRQAPTQCKDPLPLLPRALQHAPQYVPSADGIQENLLIMLHGLGDRPVNYANLARKLCLPHTCCLALSGPLEVEGTGGGRAWFEALDEEWEPIQPSRSEQRRTRSMTKTRALMCSCIDNIVAAGLWQHNQISLFGFSQVSRLTGKQS
uniref:Phospholipase/carboxylesterase/thioesterase domain-containing protein n=1 Tax=Dunaliella tertiolecta TaxID=3047 RepID=A0A7S3QLM3_DUNTE